MPQARKHTKSAPEVELRSDGWERFERAIGAAVKSGPKHRTDAIRPKREHPKPKTKGASKR
jgi:hypothetical protein